MIDIPWRAEYDALTRGAAVVSLDRTQIELAGGDRARFLHNLCTNEIRKLPPASGCEAFLTSVQGKTLAHVFVFVGDDTLVIDTVAGQGEVLLAHLDHYLVSEQVTLADRSREWGELLLAGPHAEAALAKSCAAPPPREPLAHVNTRVADLPASIRRVEMTAAGGYLISAAGGELPKIRDALLAAGAATSSPPAFEAARIEHGFPWFGRDITAANLPQEVGRDSRAISFVKGCYLGQETVARIDALGHVNRRLVGLRFAAAEVPAAGAELSEDEKPVGQVTSSAYSPRLTAAVALGYVRRGHESPGTRLGSAAGGAVVVALPMI